jgi:glycosyltransferase involved in cell wall biosynthesis
VTTRRVLICAPGMPAFDREGGARRIFHFIEFLRDAGWSVSFLAHNATGGERYARLLHQRGVAVYAGRESWYVGDDLLADPAELIAHGRFDLAILAFWSIAADYLPIFRLFAPQTRLIVDSIDLHFLRQSRRAFGPEAAGMLDRDDATAMIGELNTYSAADLVLTVSDKEADLLRDLLGQRERVATVPLMEDLPRSAIPFAERSGMLFIGNFQHPPNREALAHLRARILPRIDPALRAAHPVMVVGNRLEALEHPEAAPQEHLRMVGWVPDILPYLDRARVSVVPLLHGAGTKTKLIQALMAGTPSVSTSIGIEGLGLSDGREVLVADDPEEFAAKVALLLTDGECWGQIADRGRAHIAAAHGPDAVRQQFLNSVERALQLEPKHFVPIVDAEDESGPPSETVP